MKQITERTKTVPVLAETEVLVVGSGPGGLAAALGAAREGMDTMLVERYGCFGGGITHLCLRETRLQGDRVKCIPVSQIDEIREKVVYLRADKETIDSLPSVPVKRWWR